MRIPVPKNRLVAFTLVGALLTVAVAGGLAFPIPGLTAADDGSGGAGDVASAGSEQVAADAPTPNQNFTPAVQTQSGYGEEEHEEYEEHEDEHEEGDEYDAVAAPGVGV